jgi:hypothetical protein
VDALRRSSASVVDEALEDDLVAVALRRFTSRLTTSPWRGTATELLALLGDERRIGEQSRDRWPGSPAALTNRLRRVAPLLRQRGVEIDADGRTGERRSVVVSRTGAPMPAGESSSSYAAPSRAPPIEGAPCAEKTGQIALPAGSTERVEADGGDDDDDE